jgi:parallel beta-helix repeat protein
MKVLKKGLVIVVVMLFLSLSLSSVSVAFPKREKSAVVTYDGNILYVGGSGPGNYTKIQDAINDSNYGDTVFVYDDSSPYYENLIIDKSINLIGENNINTVILSEQNDNTILITANKVKVSNFNIQNPRNLGFGIYISSNFNIIDDNNISGVVGGLSTGILLFSASYNEIYNNIIDNTYRGNIALRKSSNNLILKNIIRYTNGTSFHGGGLIISDNSQRNKIFRNLIERCDGFFIHDSNYNIVYENSITNCTDNDDGALDLSNSNFNIIYKNNIAFNPRNGIFLYMSKGNQIIRNNLLLNHIDAAFFNCLFNHWLGNYWDSPRILPKYIRGELYISAPGGGISIPLCRLDMHPALIPIIMPPAGCDTQ